MATVVNPYWAPQRNTTPSIGEMLAQGFGKGLQQGQTRKGLAGLLGAEAAESISQLPPELQKTVIAQQMQQAGHQQERQRDSQALASMYGLGGQQGGGQQAGGMGGGAPEPGSMIPSLLGLGGAGPTTNQEILAHTLQACGLQPGGMQYGGGPQIAQQQEQQESPYEQQMQQQQMQQAPQQQQQESSSILDNLGYRRGEVAMETFNAGADLPTAMRAEQAAKRDAIKRAEKIEDDQYKLQRDLKKDEIERSERLDRKDNNLWDKADAGINEIMDKSKEAKLQNMDLQVMTDNEDKLDSPAWNAFMKGSGLDLDALSSPESNEFEAIKIGFIKNLKSYLGANVSARAMETFLKTLPSLSQSPEGRKRIIANMKRINDISIQYGKATKQAIKENNGVPSRDWRFKVDKIMKERVKKVSERFKRDRARPVPKMDELDKGFVAASHIAGSAIGAIPKLIGGAIGALGRIGG